VVVNTSYQDKLPCKIELVANTHAMIGSGQKLDKIECIGYFIFPLRIV
jgi:hypothetical protein